eukprot:GHVL01021437.1.p1 GENE.GHVL01021437.1~~GHVL01021437.1.p1  ORF type:complete len:445 (+),score=95.38 GHVL01021437.1:23-1357(+)
MISDFKINDRFELPTKNEKKIKNDEEWSRLFEIWNFFQLQSGDLQKIEFDFLAEMEKSESSLRMLDTCVAHLPTGSETGVYYSIDIGGTNYRSHRINLKNKKTKIARIKTAIPADVKSVNTEGRELFDRLAEQMATLMIREGDLTIEEQQKLIECNNKNEPIECRFEVSFTFSFAIKQETIKSAYLLHWTKEFETSGVVGEEVCQLLNDAFKRKGVPAEVGVIMNDTVSTLLAGCYENTNCRIGVILGTGTNACYLDENYKNGQKVVNIEWGGYDKLPFTSVDDDLDRESSCPGEQRLEKIVSGAYIGEVVTRLIRKIIMDFTEPMSNLSSADVSQLALDLDYAKRLFNEKALLFQTIARLVILRAAAVIACFITALSKKFDIDPIVVAIEGALFEKSEIFHYFLTKYIHMLAPRQLQERLRICLTVDGASVGGVIYLAIAHRS